MTLAMLKISSKTAREEKSTGSRASNTPKVQMFENINLCVSWKELSMGEKTILFLIALCGLSFSNDIPNIRWENPHTINVWQEYAQSSYGTLFAQSGPEDTLIIDSINFIQSQSSQYIREVSFLANKEDFISQATADSCYLISYPNSNFSGEVKNRKIILFNGDAIRLSQFNFSYTINNVYEGDTLTVVLCFCVSVHYLRSPVPPDYAKDSLILKKIALPAETVFKPASRTFVPFCELPSNALFNLLGQRVGGKEFFMGENKSHYIIIGSSDHKKIVPIF
jgi:hypothetical protein